MNQTQAQLVTVSQEIFRGMMEDNWKDNVPVYLDTVVRDTTLRALMASRNMLLSPEFPQAKKQAAFRAYMYTSLVMSVGMAHAVGNTRGRLILPFAYALDMETTKSTLHEFVNAFDGMKFGLDVRLLTSNETGEIAGVAIEWHDQITTEKK